jgi:hypothetical protein
MSYLFWAIGLIVVILSIRDVVDFEWQGTMFLMIGTLAMLITKLGLSQARGWAWLSLAFLFIPWTLIGLSDDVERGNWPGVAGEGVGLVIIVVALLVALPGLFLPSPGDPLKKQNAVPRGGPR